MCGIVGIAGTADASESASALASEALLLLQHRGQDACGIISMDGARLGMHKGFGLVSETFRSRHIAALTGEFAMGHVRYPTAGAVTAVNEIQPFYVNSPFGMSMVHNGNITNSAELRAEIGEKGRRHINSDSDSEVLLNLFAHELSQAANGRGIGPGTIARAVAGVHQKCRGAYSVCALVADHGLVAFRDPHGIRPLVLGRRETGSGVSHMVASESVALANLGYELVRDVAPGETLVIDRSLEISSHGCDLGAAHTPCLFEYVYLARPDSMIEGALVYETRINMGRSLARRIREEHPDLSIDVVVPIPESSRPTAMQLAQELGVPYREGLVKNRYIGRTFIMPDPAARRRSVRRKLSVVPHELRGRNVLLVDDSIVRGTTGREIVQMAREAGPKAIYFASAAAPVRHQNVYGIDMPSRSELIAAHRDEREVGVWLGVDRMIYQRLDHLVEAVKCENPSVSGLETSCFDGEYLPGSVAPGYLEWLEGTRGARRPGAAPEDQMDLSLAIVP